MSQMIDTRATMCALVVIDARLHDDCGLVTHYTCSCCHDESSLGPPTIPRNLKRSPVLSGEKAHTRFHITTSAMLMMEKSSSSTTRAPMTHRLDTHEREAWL